MQKITIEISVDFKYLRPRLTKENYLDFTCRPQTNAEQIMNV